MTTTTEPTGDQNGAPATQENRPVSITLTIRSDTQATTYKLISELAHIAAGYSAAGHDTTISAYNIADEDAA